MNSNGNIPVFNMNVKSPERYSSILNSLEMMVEYVVRSSWCEIGVVIQVQKIDNEFCRVSCNLLADTSFRGVAFGEGYRSSDDYAAFETRLGTGFTTLEDVKRELLLQFNWSDVALYNSEMTFYDKGCFADQPWVNYSFTVKYKRS